MSPTYIAHFTTVCRQRHDQNFVGPREGTLLKFSEIHFQDKFGSANLF